MTTKLEGGGGMGVLRPEWLDHYATSLIHNKQFLRTICKIQLLISPFSSLVEDTSLQCMALLINQSIKLIKLILQKLNKRAR